MRFASGFLIYLRTDCFLLLISHVCMLNSLDTQPSAIKKDMHAARQPQHAARRHKWVSACHDPLRGHAQVQALKRVGKEVPERWDRIAEAVPGKSRPACMKRYKEIQAAFRAKKEAA